MFIVDVIQQTTQTSVIQYYGEKNNIRSEVFREYQSLQQEALALLGEIWFTWQHYLYFVNNVVIGHLNEKNFNE